jgi:hypothetical protein
MPAISIMHTMMLIEIGTRLQAMTADTRQPTRT